MSDFRTDMDATASCSLETEDRLIRSATLMSGGFWPGAFSLALAPFATGLLFAIRGCVPRVWATHCQELRCASLASVTILVWALTLQGCSAATTHAPALPDPLIAVHCYPWYAEEFHGGQYLREHLVPPQLPALGEYSDRDPAVIAQHLAWSREAGIGVWITSWWGPASVTDVTLREHILARDDLGDLRIAPFWETVGRTEEFTDLSSIPGDMAHLSEHVFNHPNALRIDGRPVLFIYLTRALAHHGMLEQAVTSMRDAAAAHGHQIYLVGDHAFGPVPTETPEIAQLDAITNYDVYARLGLGRRLFAGGEGVARCLAEQASWRERAHALGVDFIPAVTPGFNDHGVREGHLPLSRRLDPDAPAGSLFRALLTGAMELTDPGANHLLAITSWNEWHEDTQIEPVAPAPPTRHDDSPSGNAHTEGLEYEGYGTLYLDILREVQTAP